MANKAGTCKCGHEIRYWHDPETGQCMVGREWKGHAANAYGACPCVRKVKAKKMNGTTKTTRSLTVNGNAVRQALELIRDGLTDVRQGVVTLLEQLGPDFGERPLPSLLDTKTERAPTRLPVDAPAPSSRAEVPVRAAPSRGEVGTAAVLEALAEYGGSADIAQLVIATGYAPRTLSDYLSELSTSGKVVRGQGRASLVEPVVPGAHTKPSVDARRAFWYSLLGAGEAQVLGALVALGGRATTADIAASTKFASRTVTDYLSALSRSRLLTRSNGVSTLHVELGGPS